MDDMESKLSALLGNPQMMQQIMALAQNFNQSQEPSKQEPVAKQEEPASPLGESDLSMLRKLSGLAGRTGIDGNQQSLLKALSPYLSRQRIAKLERAMQAAKMAGIATTFVNLSGR